MNCNLVIVHRLIPPSVDCPKEMNLLSPSGPLISKAHNPRWCMMDGFTCCPCLLEILAKWAIPNGAWWTILLSLLTALAKWKIQISLESTSTVRWTLPSSVWWMTFSPFASLAKQTITISLESTSKMYNPGVVYYGDSHLCLLILLLAKQTIPSGVQFCCL